MQEFLKREAEWNARIVEEYVYIAETDHLLLQDIPNRATPQLNVAFFFPYMSPVPTEQASVVKRYFDGDHLSVQPVGPSPAIVHVANLKKLTPLWYSLSVDLKHDGAADRAFGWVRGRSVPSGTFLRAARAAGAVARGSRRPRCLPSAA